MTECRHCFICLERLSRELSGHCRLCTEFNIHLNALVVRAQLNNPKDRLRIFHLLRDAADLRIEGVDDSLDRN